MYMYCILRVSVAASIQVYRIYIPVSAHVDQIMSYVWTPMGAYLGYYGITHNILLGKDIILC